MYVKLHKLTAEGRNPQPSYMPYNISSCQICRIIILRNGVANLGIKLYNKLPNKLKKLEEIQEFKRKLKYFLLQHIFNSVDEYLSEYYHQLFVTMHTFIILVFEYFCQRTY
jgi:hypothetical protein